MKQNMKRVLLVLCMVTCLFSLSACSNKANAAAEDALDEQSVAFITQTGEGLLKEIVNLSEADAEEIEAALLKQKETGLASGVTSWLGVMKDTGSFVEVVSSEASQEDDGEFSCTIVANFENRQAEIKLFYEESQQYGLMPTSISFTPVYTTGEKMAKAAMNTLMGMGTVFLVLIFISLLIGCFKYINAFEKKMKDKAAAAAPAPAVVETPVVAAVPVVEEELVDDLELVAVITAAIAAATGSTTDGLVVRSIKRAPGAKWKRA